ncbi:uncharacterized protein [Leptinotarsa decemlineata]|uniref:uncharacterized protein n=1 Tax=Leptinotarsa decemlineata TaxID=7539 RepID=UPI003D30D2BA
MKRSLSYSSMEKFRESLKSIDWGIFENTNLGINFLANFLVDTYADYVAVHFPYKRYKIGEKPPVIWYNNSLKEKRDTLSIVKCIYDTKKNPTDKVAYNSLKKSYRKELKEAKRNSYGHYISTSENKSKASWQIINYELNRKTKSNPETPIFETSFNAHFTSVAENIINQLPNIPDELIQYKHFPVRCNSFFLTGVTSYEVLDAINALKNSKSVDTHDLNCHIIRQTSDLILAPLTSMINLIFSEGIFPDSFKFTRVIPIHKKGDITEIDNYRPISIISIFAKIIEIILKIRLVKYFEKNQKPVWVSTKSLYNSCNS